MRKRRRSIDITRTRVVHARDILLETSDPLKRTRFLPSHVEIMLAASGEARRASSKLSALAECFGMELLSAMAQHAKGALALAEGTLAAPCDETSKATAGTIVFAPRDVAHSLTIDSEQVPILVMFAPAGAEAFFKECSVPAPSIALPSPSEIPYSEIQKMMTLAPTYGFEFVPPQH
jgi:hypothetical protein